MAFSEVVHIQYKTSSWSLFIAGATVCLLQPQPPTSHRNTYFYCVGTFVSLWLDDLSA